MADITGEELEAITCLKRALMSLIVGDDTSFVATTMKEKYQTRETHKHSEI